MVDNLTLIQIQDHIFDKGLNIGDLRAIGKVDKQTLTIFINNRIITATIIRNIMLLKMDQINLIHFQ